MKTLGHIVLCVCLFLIGTLVLAQDSNTPSTASAPVPPMQSAPWSASSLVLSTNLGSAVEVLFRTGMADPRGCDYREIEIVVGSLVKPSGVTVKTRGWVLPAAPGARTNYGIGWNGLIYPLVSVGNPASADEDARAMVRVITDVMTQNKHLGSLRSQICTTEDYSVGTQWLTAAKVAMILRFGSPELAEACGRLIEKDEPFLLLATDRLWTMYDRATGFHLRADDDVAYQLSVALVQARETCEAEAKSRGLQFDQRLEPGYSKAESYFPFLVKASPPASRPGAAAPPHFPSA